MESEWRSKEMRGEGGNRERMEIKRDEGEGWEWRSKEMRGEGGNGEKMEIKRDEGEGWEWRGNGDQKR